MLHLQHCCFSSIHVEEVRHAPAVSHPTQKQYSSEGPADGGCDRSRQGGECFSRPPRSQATLLNAYPAPLVLPEGHPRARLLLKSGAIPSAVPNRTLELSAEHELDTTRRARACRASVQDPGNAAEAGGRPDGQIRRGARNRPDARARGFELRMV